MSLHTSRRERAAPYGQLANYMSPPRRWDLPQAATVGTHGAAHAGGACTLDYGAEQTGHRSNHVEG